jgi:hypothetical protein
VVQVVVVVVVVVVVEAVVEAVVVAEVRGCLEQRTRVVSVQESCRMRELFAQLMQGQLTY